jgi:hypothetical protein
MVSIYNLQHRHRRERRWLGMKFGSSNQQYFYVNFKVKLGHHHLQEVILDSCCQGH